MSVPTQCWPVELNENCQDRYFQLFYKNSSEFMSQLLKLIQDGNSLISCNPKRYRDVATSGWPFTIHIYYERKLKDQAIRTIQANQVILTRQFGCKMRPFIWKPVDQEGKSTRPPQVNRIEDSESMYAQYKHYYEDLYEDKSFSLGSCLKD